MALQGDLLDIPFADLVEIMTRKDTNGVLRVRYTDTNCEGVVLVADFALHSAWVTRTTPGGRECLHYGTAALRSLASRTEGTFTYTMLTPDYAFPTPNVPQAAQDDVLAGVFGRQSDSPMWSAGGGQATLVQTAPMRVAEQPRALPINHYKCSDAPKPAPVAPPKVQRGWLGNIIARLRAL